jgi:YEATS domain-containing protein 4
MLNQNLYLNIQQNPQNSIIIQQNQSSFPSNNNNNNINTSISQNKKPTCLNLLQLNKTNNDLKNFQNNSSLINNNENNKSDNNNNNPNEIITKSIVYGSIAFWLGKKSEENLTHKWCVYVRGNNNEDISYFVKEVIFTLHSTFENNVRTITKWPYELYASGWGEFDIKINIILRDEAIKPIEFVHFLKLYSSSNQTPTIKKPIVSEFFDEIVFVNPKKQLRDCLLSGNNNPGYKKETSFQIPIYNSSDEEENLNTFNNNNNNLKDQVLENRLEGLSISNTNKSDNSNINNNNNFDTEMGNSENVSKIK